MEHYIGSIIKPSILVLLDCKFQSVRTSNSRTGNIQLSMGEYLRPEPDTHMLHGLTLRLVDCRCKGRLNWELPSPPIKGILISFRNEDNPGNQHCPVATRHNTLQDSVVNCSLKHQLGSITEAFSGVDVSQEHQRHARLQ